MGENKTLTASDDHKFTAYHVNAGGERGRRGGLVVVQEIFGVNDHIRAVCDGYAAMGFEVYAPALFDRVERDVELGYTDDDVARGLELKGRLDWIGPLLDVQASVAEMRIQGEVGAVGYCYGGSVTWLSACKVIGLTAAVCYYGGQVHELKNNTPKCPVMLHFGKQDSMIPMNQVDEIRQAHPDCETFIYDADHGFNCDHRGSYNEAAAKEALERTHAFFAEHVLTA